MTTVRICGFHLMSVDLRQSSRVHERNLAELLDRSGRPGYLALPEVER